MREHDLEERELQQRIRILRSLRRHLVAQRAKFRSYLDLLEREEEAILAEDVDKLHAQAQMEGAIVREIAALQRIIDPLASLYRTAFPQAEQSIPPLQAGLERLRQDVLRKNARNRTLLKGRMSEIRQEIKALRRNKRPMFPIAERATGAMVDIKT